jgi:curved DNA-binding protein
MARDYYDILGVSKNADEKELKRAFRQMAKQYHPDANPDNPNAEQKFKEVNEAYEVLSDPDKRRAYDQFGHNYSNFTGFNGANGGAQTDFSGTPFADIFDMFTNTGRGRTSTGGFGGFDSFGGAGMSQDGQDIEHHITITLREAYEGTTRYITKDGRRIKVNIPAGANTGTKVRLSGEGYPARGNGRPGDLFLIVNVEEDNTFGREGDDLTVDVYVDVFTAMLGGKAEVPTMGRPVMVTVKPGSQSGTKLRLKGKGMPLRKSPGTFGNLYARLLITVPEALSDEQRELAQRLRDSLND